MCGEDMIEGEDEEKKATSPGGAAHIRTCEEERVLSESPAVATNIAGFTTDRRKATERLMSNRAPWREGGSQ
jgi:hypothetical protein